jgi:PIN domain nuclease of toxin-antitoxin system
MFEPEKLSTQAQILLTDSATLTFFSAASIWEIEIKQCKGKIRLPNNFYDKLEETGFLELPIHAAHATTTRHLPDIHKDPFDRLLLAQAIYEKWTLLTADAVLLRYQPHYSKITQI